ncbi:glycosyltransferase involved in cell wall biosynthesis [Phyllobacterium ifriqiyense]|uniref:Glycosyltransferase involved in cell wall biosynthesis n=1 Tax=Phyllobacterium ifriqiyense TaxID=314238 RepID=A0ABU0S4S2_9HYPH|nr:glycosyltransferase family 1 protein [Phyllobacterium ifriqiyense]MDQ0995758.1 glycosyltransferase involved in cell wall biosynthesis [Phyllobacterium ifriqiyense]
MMNAIAMDISRLIDRSHFSTPTGIDRFELQYANWAKARSSYFIEMGRTKPIEINRGRANGLISELEQRWSTAALTQSQSTELEQIYAAIDGRLSWSQLKSIVPTKNKSKLQQWGMNAGKVLRTILPMSRLATSAPFVHVSHTNLHRPAAFSWLDAQRSNGIFYVHDLIPLTHPEFVRKNEPQRHLQRMETVLKHAGLVLCNSQTTARSFETFAEEQGRAVPPIAVLPPGVEHSFNVASRAARRSKRPYFLMVGTIEPRKNHAMILQLWRALVDEHGKDTPRLVIAGKRGWENAQVFATLERCPQLRDIVIEAPDLGDAALADLMAGATALLAPSFAEGYGMPLAEAMATGTTIIASNIPSHKEIAGEHAIFLDPLDGLGWREAIETHAAEHRRRAPLTLQKWEKHFDQLDELLDAAARQKSNADRQTSANHSGK